MDVKSEREAFVNFNLSKTRIAASGGKTIELIYVN